VDEAVSETSCVEGFLRHLSLTHPCDSALQVSASDEESEDLAGTHRPVPLPFPLQPVAEVRVFVAAKTQSEGMGACRERGRQRGGCGW
jgi:hypothetical protein